MIVNLHTKSLSLTRGPGQAVCLGDEIKVTVLRVKGNRVRLKFQAPPEVAVDREEIFARKRREQEGAPWD